MAEEQSTITVNASAFPALLLCRDHATDHYVRIAIFLGKTRVAFVQLKRSIARSAKLIDLLRDIITMKHNPLPIPAGEIEIGGVRYQIPEMMPSCPYLHDDNFEGGVLREYQHIYLFFSTKQHWDAAVENVDKLKVVNVEVVYDMPPPMMV
jgi:hypothetical protein